MEVSGFVTRTSQSRSFFGPPVLVVTAITIEFPPNEIIVAVGVGPWPPENVTLAPTAKPSPEIVMISVNPEPISPSLIDRTVTSAG